MNYVGNPPAPAGLVLVGDTNPIGAIVWFHAPPDGSWLRLNGQAALKATYPDLWAYAQAFLTADQVANPGLYKSIDANTFALPKLDGLFIRATGQFDANRVSGALGVRQDDLFKSHTHPIQAAATGGATPSLVSLVGATPGVINTDPTGGVETRPTNVALQPCVKALRTVLVSAASLPTPSLPLDRVAASLVANVATGALNAWTDGPTLALGAGVWLAMGTLTVTDPGAAAQFEGRLWDGTTVGASTKGTVAAAGWFLSLPLSAIFVNPPASVRLAARNLSTANGLMLANGSGQGKDSTLTAIRIG